MAENVTRIKLKTEITINVGASVKIWKKHYVCKKKIIKSYLESCNM